MTNKTADTALATPIPTPPVTQDAVELACEAWHNADLESSRAWTPWADCLPEYKAHVRACITAALAASGHAPTPEPTEAMLDVVDTLPQPSDRREYARLLWRAMATRAAGGE